MESSWNRPGTPAQSKGVFWVIQFNNNFTECSGERQCPTQIFDLKLLTEQALQADFFDGSIWNVLMALLSTINKMRLTLTFLGRSHGVYDTQWEQQERVIWKEHGNMPSAHKGNFEKQMEKISEFSAAPKEQMKNFWVNKAESERLRNKVFGQII